MAILNSIGWSSRSGAGADIHVVLGQKTRTLDNMIVITDSDGNVFDLRDTAKCTAVGITGARFEAIFPFDLNIHGLTVDRTNGEVTTKVRPAPPAVRRSPNNFIIVATVIGPTPPFEFKIRVHLHNSILSSPVLTPSTLTLRAESTPLPPPAPILSETRARFTVLAEFDDHVVANLSYHGDPGVPATVIKWNSSRPADVSVDAEGWLRARNSTGHSEIEATLPAELGGRAGPRATVQNAAPWDKAIQVPRRGALVEALPESANLSATAEIPNLLFLPSGFVAAEETAFKALVRRLVKRWKRARSTRPFDLVPMNYFTAWVPSRERGGSPRNLLQLRNRTVTATTPIWGEAVPTPEPFVVTGAPVSKVNELVLLCHKRPQEGQHGSSRASARAMSDRMVAMDAGLWRSGRTGTSPWAETFGYGSGSEEG